MEPCSLWHRTSLHSYMEWQYCKRTDIDSCWCGVAVLCGRGMFSKEVIGKMKKGAYLVNNARGGIVDRDAIVEACKSGQLAGDTPLSL